MLRRLQEYDQAHSTALLHTLCVYLLQEQNLHATARHHPALLREQPERL